MPTKKMMARYYELNEQKKQIEAQLAQLKAQMNITEPGIFEVNDEIVLEAIPNKRFDAARAATVLTPEELASISILTPNSALAKQKLSGDRYAEIQSTNGVSLTWRQKN